MNRRTCDDLWKEVVKKRAGFKCEKCGNTRYLQAHHIIPRTNYALRYDLKNGVALCRRCHLFWSHKDSVGFVRWISKKRDMDYLESRRYGQSKNDYQLIEIYLKQEGK